MNKPELVSETEMPDVAMRELLNPEGTLDWVGMSDVHQPLKIHDGHEEREVQAKVQIYVNLDDTQAKGIHMSRLYLILDEHSSNRPLTVAGLKLLLSSLLESHRGLSTSAFIQFDFDYYVRRSALVSENAGWNSYPVSLKGTYVNGEVNVELSLGVLYSSTCPCSAALARQLIQQQFEEDFGRLGDVKMSEVKAWLGTEDGIMATPHSQRSLARVLVKLDDSMESFPITDLIDGVEDVLKTPVQTAVKREDEREFARLNGANLMFCEDAGRKLKTSLESDQRVKDFWVRVEHHESLHAHNAVSVFTKGVEKGYLPIP
ncbi:MAG: GTP cyclohydrolase FolE2 [Gammaproteobacteria bacterium]|nr:MAG: GTP cyclohydrolase FolE2 [Gammaproteobacteria bacterium]